MSAHWYFGNMGDSNGISVQSFGNRTIITLPDNMTIVATGGSVSFTAASNRCSGSRNRSYRGRNRPGPRGPAHANNNNRNNGNNNQNQHRNNRDRGRRGQRRRNQNRWQGNRGTPRGIEAGPAYVNASADAHHQAHAAVDINTARTTIAAVPVPVPAGPDPGVAMEVDEWNGNGNVTYEPTYDPHRNPTEEGGNLPLNVTCGQEHADHHPKQESGDDWRIITASGYDAGLDFDVSEEYFAGKSVSGATNLIDFTENASTGTL